jgi:CBS domain-containing protein
MELPRYVEEVMTYPVIAVRPGAAAGEVASELARRGIAALPVVDRSLHVLGVVAGSDLLADDRNEWATAGDLMSSPAVTVTPHTTVVQARALLASRGLGRLPVVGGQRRLVGIVSRRDLRLSGLPGDERIKRCVLDRALAVGGQVGYVSVRNGMVRVRARVARRSAAPVLERLLVRIPGVARLEADIGFELDDMTVADGPVREEAP